MKKQLLPGLLLTVALIPLIMIIYPCIVYGIALLTPDKGKGERILLHNNYQYTNIGQSFTSENYFWSRPSATGYNAAGSCGSNKGPSNPEYLSIIHSRIDSFLVHHPYVRQESIPVEMVTASGSGLDPHISPQAARLQSARVAANRHLPRHEVEALVEKHIHEPLLGLFGPPTVNVLELNIDLDNTTK